MSAVQHISARVESIVPVLGDDPDPDMYKCRNCGRDVETDTETCPNCSSTNLRPLYL